MVWDFLQIDEFMGSDRTSVETRLPCDLQYCQDNWGGPFGGFQTNRPF